MNSRNPVTDMSTRSNLNSGFTSTLSEPLTNSYEEVRDVFCNIDSKNTYLTVIGEPIDETSFRTIDNAIPVLRGKFLSSLHMRLNFLNPIIEESDIITR